MRIDGNVLGRRREPYQIAECSMKKNWVKSLPGMNIPPESPSDILHRTFAV
jgi:hypothetical protein